MANFLSPLFNEQTFTANGDPAVGYKVNTYEAGTSTPIDTFTTKNGNTAQSNPIVLNARGAPDDVIWLAQGVSYKFVLTDANDVVIDTFDNISGINDTSVSSGEWTASGYTPTYIGATSFSVVWDRTGDFLVGRRVRSTNTGGTTYSLITSSSYSAGTGLTTVTLSNDSGTLDAGLSSVDLAILTPDNPSVPNSPETRQALGLEIGVDVAATGANGDITNLTALQSINGGQLAGTRNAIINGGFRINQRQLASNADDTYSHDRWYVLTQTNTIAVSTLTDVENGTPFMARLTQSQASAQRMGYAQIIEGKDCKHLRGKQVTFRFGRKRLSTSANVRIAVLEWTGTEDTVTSDVVNDWTSSTYTAGNFFLGSNLTVSGVVQQALTANTLTDGEEVTVTLGSSFNNLIVFAWTEAAVAQNVTFDLAKAQLEIGGVATPYESMSYATEFAICQRYFQHHSNPILMGVGSGTASVGRLGMQLPVKMRASPTASQSGTWDVYDGFATSSISSFGTSYLAADRVAFDITTPPASTSQGRPYVVASSGSGVLSLSAEL